MDHHSATRRDLTVNAAFLKDIKDDNQELKQLLDKIVPLTDPLPMAVNHWSELVALLGDLRDQLAMHFALEEAYGYFEDALVTAPQLTLAAHSLKRQHIKLFEQIVRLAEKAAELPADAESQIAKLLQQFKSFQLDFQTHEREELDLILQALEDDIGVGD